jgi:sugar-phosphatase
LRPLGDYAAVLADLDGTLVDSDGSVARSWTKFAVRHGLEPDAVIRAAQGRPAREVAAQFVSPAELDAETELLEESETTDTEGVIALPGAHQLLSSSLRLAIVTSGSRRLATTRLRASELPVPEVLVCSDDVTTGKPDPEPYLRAAERLGADPGDCVALEDAPAGIASAKAAGAAVIAVRTNRADRELAAADAIVDTVSDLLPAA